jgi:hypothetical protein
MGSADHIAGSEMVEEALGYWPTFHDAEVISFSADRALPLTKGYTVARLAVHVRHYETVGEGTAQYEQVLRKSLLVRFVFNGAREFELSGFNHQNVINSITVSRLEANEGEGLLVDVESIWGFSGTLRCSSVAVEAVEVLPSGEA